MSVYEKYELLPTVSEKIQMNVAKPSPLIYAGVAGSFLIFLVAMAKGRKT